MDAVDARALDEMILARVGATATAAVDA